MPSLLITATDTAAGKTVLAAAMAKAWRTAGLDTGVMKPFASGCRRAADGTLVSDDALLLRAASQSSDPMALIAPQCFEAPLAPVAAAPMERREIDIGAADAALAELQRRHEWLVVEGLGGALAPITSEVSVADWAARRSLPALVVARTDLGTLNHTRLTLEALASRGVRVLGVVLNRLHGGAPTLAEQTNPGILARLIDVPIWGPVDFEESIRDGDPPDLIAANLPPLPFADEIRARLVQRS
jgi:dethiobiotin synthetase